MSRRLVQDQGDARFLCESEGRVFGGLEYGSLLEWDASTLEELLRLRCEGDFEPVWAMTACGDLVIASGHDDDDCLRV